MAPGAPTWDFVCPFCHWEGTDPTLDAHANAWCPRCGRPAQLKAFMKRPRGSP